MAMFVSQRQKRIELIKIGYDFNEKFWNKGYATEACIALLNHIFCEVGGRRVYAECNDDNFPSIKLLERIGNETRRIFY